MVRPTAAELEVARALITRMKAADPSLKKADEILVCAAIVCRAGEFDGVPTVCARKMGKEISRPSQVTNWVERLEKLEQASASPSGSGLHVQPAWIEEHTPGIRNLVVAPIALSPGKRHAKRAISAVSATPRGSSRETSATIDYTMPPAEGERESAAKRRDDRHRRREESQLRRLDLSGAFEVHAAREAERQRVAREREREVSDVLDRVIIRIERQLQREWRAGSRAAKPWRCPAGCRNGRTWLGGNDFCPCARETFRQQCVPTCADIQREQRAQWDNEHLTKVFVSSYSGYEFGSKMQRQLRAEEDAAAEAWRPSFEISETEVAEIQQAFLSLWDGLLAPAAWLKHWLEHGEHATGHGDEYRGKHAKLLCDRFGPDHHPVGAAACARRGCTGCCRCFGESPPVYLETCTSYPRHWMELSRSMPPGKAWARAWCPAWVSMDELFGMLQHTLVPPSASVFDRGPVPAYLLGRHAPDALDCRPGGCRLICLPGGVRSHVDAGQLAQWAEQAAVASVRLEILSGESRQCAPHRTPPPLPPSLSGAPAGMAGVCQTRMRRRA
jgi:hypothetical protein